MRQNAHVHVKTGKHNIDGGENRGLRTDERIDIHFRDGNFAARLRFGRSGQNIAAHAVLVVRDALTGADKLTLGGDDGRAVKFCNDINDAGAADADGLLALRPDDAECRLHRILVDLHGFDRTVCCTHAAGDIAALKRRACRAGAGHHEIAVAEDQLAVRAEVDEERKFVLIPDKARECTCGDIAANIRADVRRQQNFRVRVGREAEILGRHATPLEKRRDIRLHAHGVRVHAQKQMVHRRVRRDADAEHTRDGNARRFTHRRNERQQRFL